MDRKKLRRAYIGNCLTAALTLFAAAWMFTGFSFSRAAEALSARCWGMLRYYTVDSNILMGLSAAVTACAQRAVLSGRRASLPIAVRVLKLAGVTAVALTMLVTVFFLAPTSLLGFSSLFRGSNLYMHCVIPLLSIFVFLFWERDGDIPRRYSAYAVVSVAVYAAFYIANCALHLTDGAVSRYYDWYGFAAGGLVKGCLLVLPLLLLCAYGIGLLLWRLNRGGRA